MNLEKLSLSELSHEEMIETTGGSLASWIATAIVVVATILMILF